MHNKCNALESSRSHLPTPVRGKIVFRETASWCQKGWGPLLYRLWLDWWYNLLFKTWHFKSERNGIYNGIGSEVINQDILSLWLWLKSPVGKTYLQLISTNMVKFFQQLLFELVCHLQGSLFLTHQCHFQYNYMVQIQPPLQIVHVFNHLLHLSLKSCQEL